MTTGAKTMAGFNYLVCGNARAERCIYYLGLPQQAGAVQKELAGFPCTVVFIEISDWDNQLTPWPAPGLYRGDADFKGEAPDTLKALVERLVPGIEAAEGLGPRRRSVAGYSLAGLFSVYAFANSSVFDSVASMSGSFWYEGWLDYLKGLRPDKAGCFAYFSLGTKESSANPPILHSVKDNTDATAAALERWGARVESRMVPGGHISHVSERINAGLSALAAQDA